MVFNDWWHTLNFAEQVLWSLAIVSSLLSVIQSVLGLIGFDLYEDKETSTSRPEVSNRILSPTNILTFLTFASWSSIIALNLQVPLLSALLVGMIMGLLMSALIHFLLYTEDKIIDLQETINHTGQVFQSIPPCKNGQGSIQVEIRGTVLELAAMTEGNALPQGAIVKVIEITDENTLVVQPVIKTP